MANDRGPAGKASPGSTEPHEPAQTVLQQLSLRTGREGPLTLPDTGSEHGVSPLIDARSPDAQALPAGKGNYQVLGEIARGGMGVILKSHDTDLGRDVAMKVLRPEHAGSSAILQRFVEEAQIGGQLQHPGIVPVYELGLMADQRPYFTMKLVKGRTLAKILTEREGPERDRRRLLGIFEKICETLAYAHARNVLHRDLKPANIMVGAFGEVQVVDWGLAKVLKDGGVNDERRAEISQAQLSIIETVRSGSSTADSESMVGSIMGTPAYMPPEQAQGEIDMLDERADVFALGAILCEILTGKPPYAGDRERIIQDAARARLDDARARLAASGADDEIVAICNECLAPAKAARPRSAEVLLERVHAWAANQEERVRRAQLRAAEAAIKAKAEAKARRLTLALAATVLAVGLAAGGLYVRSQGQAAEVRSQLVAELDSQLEQAGVARGQGNFAAALAACDRADAVLSASDVDASLTASLAARVETARQEVSASEHAVLSRRAESDRVDAFLADLEQELLGEGLDVPHFGVRARRRDSFGALFAGFEVDFGHPDAAFTRLASVGDNLAVAVALDEYSRIIRTFGWNSAEADGITALAQRLDPDPVRGRLRAAIQAGDRSVLSDIVASNEALGWPPSTVVMLHLAQDAMGMALDVEPLLMACQRRHPGDPAVNQVLASHLQYTQEDPAAALPYLHAALAARPDNDVVGARLSWALAELGRYAEARSTLAEVVVRNVDTGWLTGLGLNNLTGALPWEQRYDVGLEVHERAVAAHPDNDGRRSDWAWFVVISPAATDDQVQGAVEVLQELISRGSLEHFTQNTLGFGLLRLGRSEEALAAFQRSIEVTEAALQEDVLGVSIALWDLGKRELAREWFRSTEQLQLADSDTDWHMDLFWEMAEARFGPR